MTNTKSPQKRSKPKESDLSNYIRRTIGVGIIVGSLWLGYHLLQPEPIFQQPLQKPIGAPKQAHLSDFEFQFAREDSFITGLKFKGFEVGGLSGLAYEKATSRFLSISDDRGRKGPPRWFEWKLDAKGEPLLVQAVVLKSKNKKPFKEREIDPEGIALLPSGRVAVSSEGDRGAKVPAAPRLMVFSRQGQWLQDIALPKNLWREGDEKYGVQDNQALEGLSVSPDGRWLYTSLEGSLLQDLEAKGDFEGSVSRIIELDLAEEPVAQTAQLAYPVSPLPKVKGSMGLGVIGISDILSLKQREFLVIERAYLAERSLTFVKVYYANCLTADDVQHLERITPAKQKLCNKELVLDVNEALANKSFKVDNMEGIALVQTREGMQLVMVADNNFRNEQQTQWLFFDLLNQGKPAQGVHSPSDD